MLYKVLNKPFDISDNAHCFEGLREYKYEAWGGAVGGLYKLYRYLPRQRVWFLRRFGLKTGIDFAHFCLNWVWFSRELGECMKVFFISVLNE